MTKIGFEDFVLACWDIDDAGWRFKLFSDQWWEMKAVSDTLGEFRAVSMGPVDVEETLSKLLGKIKEAKLSC